MKASAVVDHDQIDVRLPNALQLLGGLDQKAAAPKGMIDPSAFKAVDEHSNFDFIRSDPKQHAFGPMRVAGAT